MACGEGGGDDDGEVYADELEDVGEGMGCENIVLL